MNCENMMHDKIKKIGLTLCLLIFLLNVHSHTNLNQIGIVCDNQSIDKVLETQSILSKDDVFSKHLTVLGIPITGSITTFQHRLIAKGFRLNTKRNKELPVGQREFKGSYSGHQCSLRVYYFPEDNIVYKVRVSIDFSSEFKADNAYQEIKRNLLRKYCNADIRIRSTDGHESLHALIIDDEDDILGYIDLIVFEGSDIYERELVVGYTDMEGFCIEEKKHTDDI